MKYGQGQQTQAQPHAAPYQSTGYSGMPTPDGEQLSLFVGDLSPEINDYWLLQTFQYYYPSAYQAKVIMDSRTGNNKGYGFVYFGDQTEKDRALVEMNGYYLGMRPLNIRPATKKGSGPLAPQQIVQQQQQQAAAAAAYSAATHTPGYPPAPMTVAHTPTAQAQAPYGYRPPAPAPGAVPNPPQGPSDPTNTIVFVGGVDWSITPDLIKHYFAPWGEIKAVNMPRNKGCAFIHFAQHEQALKVLNECPQPVALGTAMLRLQWGKPPKAQIEGTQAQPPVQVQPPRPTPASTTQATNGEASGEKRPIEESNATDDAQDQGEESQQTKRPRTADSEEAENEQVDKEDAQDEQ